MMGPLNTLLVKRQTIHV